MSSEQVMSAWILPGHVHSTTFVSICTLATVCIYTPITGSLIRWTKLYGSNSIYAPAVQVTCELVTFTHLK